MQLREATAPSGTGRDAGLCSTVFCGLLTAVQRDSEWSVKEDWLGSGCFLSRIQVVFSQASHLYHPLFKGIVFMFLHEPEGTMTPNTIFYGPIEMPQTYRLTEATRSLIKLLKISSFLLPLVH